MIRLNVYQCETCGSVFYDYEECRSHELECNRCKHCSNAYYVYGCEFNCKYIDDCHSPDWKHYEDMFDVEDIE